MDIRIVVFVIMPQRLDHGAWLLRRGRVVEIDQRLSLDTFAKDREILADRFPIEADRA
jgi:hypothetical protein